MTPEQLRRVIKIAVMRGVPSAVVGDCLQDAVVGLLAAGKPLDDVHVICATKWRWLSKLRRRTRRRNLVRNGVWSAWFQEQGGEW